MLEINRNLDLNQLMEIFDDKLFGKKFAEVDETLRVLDCTEYSFEQLGGILVITFVWKKMLTERDFFFKRVRKTILNELTVEETNQMLEGLE